MCTRTRYTLNRLLVVFLFTFSFVYWQLSNWTHCGPKTRYQNNVFFAHIGVSLPLLQMILYLFVRFGDCFSVFLILKYIQNRFPGGNFTRGWNEYRDGFGDLTSGSFWLGNEKVRQLTEDGAASWEIQVKVFATQWWHSEPSNFRLSGDNYTLQVDGRMQYKDGKQDLSHWSHQAHRLVVIITYRNPYLFWWRFCTNASLNK